MDPHPVERVVVEQLSRLRERGVQCLPGRLAVILDGIGDPFGSRPEHENGIVRLGLDLHLGREANAAQLAGEPLPQPGLGREQVVVDLPAQHDHRCDHAGLRCEQERLTGLAEIDRHVLREHALQKLLGVRAGDTHEVAAAPGDA